MNFLAILKLLLALADNLTSYLHDRQLMEAGAAQETLKNIKGAQDAISKAEAIRRDVRRDLDANPDRVSDDDGFRRG